MSASARPRWRCAPPSPPRIERQAGRGRGADDAARAPALPQFRRALQRPAGQGRARPRASFGADDLKTVKAGINDGTIDIVVGTHALLGKGDRVQGSRPRHRRRGAAFRRQPQGAAEGVPRRGPCADAVGDADPAHAPARHDRRARALDHRDAAGRPARGAHLRHAVRSADRARGAAARALSRRPELLCRAAHRGHRRRQGLPRQAGAGGQGRHRAWPDGGGPARGRDDGLLRGQVRRPALDHDRRIRPRHSRPPTR